MDTNVIITFGLTERQNEIIKKSLPSKDYRLIITETFTDVIALTYTTAIVNANNICIDEREMMLSYYEEVSEMLYETICWIDAKTLSAKILKTFRRYKNFKIFEKEAKQFLLKAHCLYKKEKDFSNENAN